MPINRRPLRRSIFIGSSIFIILLCLILSILTYTTYTGSLYKSYEERMTDIINYVETHIDVDDLSECVATGVESEKYHELMAFMDSIMEDFDIHYLYISRPIMDRDSYGMINILSADTALGRETDPDGLTLNYFMEGDYSYDNIELYYKAMREGNLFYRLHLCCNSVIENFLGTPRAIIKNRHFETCLTHGNTS